MTDTKKSCCARTGCGLPYTDRLDLRLRNKGNCPGWKLDPEYQTLLDAIWLEKFNEDISTMRRRNRNARIKKLWTGFCKGFWGVFGVRH